jgi:hypothetical protein
VRFLSISQAMVNPPNQSFSLCGVANVLQLPELIVHALTHSFDLIVLIRIVLAFIGLNIIRRAGEWILATDFVESALFRLVAALHGVAHCFEISQAAGLF